MIGKKGKIILIILIFMMVFEFCSPIVYAAGDGMIPDVQAQQEAAKGVQTTAPQKKATLGTVVDHGLRFTH